MCPRNTSSCLGTAFLLLLVPYTAAAQVLDRASAGQGGPDNTLGNQSDADMWRAIRQGEAGLPSASSLSSEQGVLVNAQGVWWSDMRADWVITYGATVLLGVILVIALYFALRGRIRIDGGRSGRRITRFSLLQRIAHWSVATLFLFLALTGLVLMFGRYALVPLIGHEAFSVAATAAMQAHNLFGPIFTLALVTLFIVFVRNNFPELTDVGWLLRGGGLFGGHASAGRYNFGEKLWFWIAVSAGTALSVTGFLLLFPDAFATRNQLQLAGTVHGIAAIVFVGFACGHIYLGTVGTEGTLEGMTQGDVDENWARTHHDLWLKKVVTDIEDQRV